MRRQLIGVDPTSGLATVLVFDEDDNLVGVDMYVDENAPVEPVTEPDGSGAWSRFVDWWMGR